VPGALFAQASNQPCLALPHDVFSRFPPLEKEGQGGFNGVGKFLSKQCAGHYWGAPGEAASSSEFFAAPVKKVGGWRLNCYNGEVAF
jgi:hypothetical protein